MADQIPEAQMPKPKNLPPKAMPEKAVEAPLGQAKQTIVARIDQDGDEDKVLQDIAGTDNKLPGGPLRIRPMSINGVDYDPYHPPKLYRNPDGTTEYRGGKPLKDTGSVEVSTPGQEHSQETEATNAPAYKAIFEGVYDQMRQAAYGKTPEEQGQRFIESIAQKVPMHIGEIQSQNLTNQAIYQEIWGRMGAYIMRYNGTPRFEEKKQDVSAVYSKLTGHIDTLVAGGEVDPLTAKVFARYLERYKHIGGLHYNAIVANNQELPEGTLKQKAPEYANAVGRLVSDYGEDAKEQESGVLYILMQTNKQAK